MRGFALVPPSAAWLALSPKTLEVYLYEEASPVLVLSLTAVPLSASLIAHIAGMRATLSKTIWHYLARCHGDHDPRAKTAQNTISNGTRKVSALYRASRAGTTPSPRSHRAPPSCAPRRCKTESEPAHHHLTDDASLTTGSPRSCQERHPPRWMCADARSDGRNRRQLRHPRQLREAHHQINMFGGKDRRPRNGCGPADACGCGSTQYLTATGFRRCWAKVFADNRALIRLQRQRATVATHHLPRLQRQPGRCGTRRAHRHQLRASPRHVYVAG